MALEENLLIPYCPIHSRIAEKLEKVWYLHLDWTWDEEVTVCDVDKPAELIYLRTGDPVPFNYCNREITFQFPQNWKTILTDVVKIIW